MGFRFRKSINLGGGARLNISKSGVGGSIGGKGYRYTKKADGGTRKTAYIPGTGISYVKESGKSKSQVKEAVSAVPATPNYLLFWIIWRILSVVMIAAGLLLTFIMPVVGVISIALGIGEWMLATYFKKKHKKNF